MACSAFLTGHSGKYQGQGCGAGVWGLEWGLSVGQGLHHELASAGTSVLPSPNRQGGSRGGGQGPKLSREGAGAETR